MYTCPHVHTCTHAHIHTSTHIHTHTCTCTCTHTHTQANGSVWDSPSLTSAAITARASTISGLSCGSACESSRWGHCTVMRPWTGRSASTAEQGCACTNTYMHAQQCRPKLSTIHMAVGATSGFTYYVYTSISIYIYIYTYIHMYNIIPIGASL